jgi:hypothetical protein
MVTVAAVEEAPVFLDVAGGAIGAAEAGAS